eukprot:jgi/Psemu1/302690/fgenesh1_kg.78_\
MWIANLLAISRFTRLHTHMIYLQHSYHQRLSTVASCVIQLLTRMKMTWTGDSAIADEYKKTFRIVLGIVVFNYLVYSFFYCPLEIPEETDTGDFIMVENPDCAASSSYFSQVVGFLVNGYAFVVMIRLRMAIRDKYSIPEEYCTGCEDCCCIAFCGCLSAVQMAHQTADYDVVRGVCLSTTGLPPGEELTEAIVV